MRNDLPCDTVTSVFTDVAASTRLLREFSAERTSPAIAEAALA